MWTSVYSLYSTHFLFFLPRREQRRLLSTLSTRRLWLLLKAMFDKCQEQNMSKHFKFWSNSNGDTQRGPVQGNTHKSLFYKWHFRQTHVCYLLPVDEVVVVVLLISTTSYCVSHPQLVAVVLMVMIINLHLILKAPFSALKDTVQRYSKVKKIRTIR